MINNVSSPNGVSFSGINPKNLKAFIPELSDDVAKSFSKMSDMLIPNDELVAVCKGKVDSLMHLKSFGDFKLPIGQVQYNGADNAEKKLEFLTNVMEKIQKGTLYA